MSLSSWHELFQTCHELYGIVGALLTADHWQSPAFGSVDVDEVGDEQGRIIANLNDYKRDQHPLGVAWEKAYADMYLTHSFVTTPKAFATTSGMAALTVALFVIRQRLPEEYRIAVGRHSYFENFELLHMMFPKQNLYLFDEDHADTLKQIRPHAIFFDMIANDPEITVADSDGILKCAGTIGHHVDVVVDTTCASIAHFRVPAAVRMRGNVSVIGFESLNKYHQFGLDRTTGGVVWAMGILEDTIYRIRDHAGLNISEAAVAMLPSPNRALHIKYLRQLEQNAKIIANRLAAISGINVCYPGLSTHPDHRLVKRGYTGSFVSVTFPGSSWRRYRKSLQDILVNAKNQHVPVIAGGTFGTSVSRIYTWMPRSEFEKPFLRIAAGLETPKEMVGVCDVLERAFS